MSSFNLEVFNELRQKYPSWEQLKNFLESEEGGYIRVISTNPSNKLCILRYDKQFSKFELPHTKWFRSVVWNMETNMPVSVAPSRTSSEEFNTGITLNNFNSSGFYCQEFMEGFMINCFKMAGDNSFYITSRSCFDATGNFYSKKSFRELFNDAIAVSYNSLDSFMNKYDIVPCERKGELSRFYSFIVYHPEHRIVSKNEIPGYKEVHSGVVYSDGKISLTDNFSIPKILMESQESESQESVQDFIQKYLSEKNWGYQGVVIKDISGNRWRFRNDKYQLVKSLRGNHNSMLTRFVLMFQQNISRKYLEYYPEESLEFNVYQLILINVINTIKNNYNNLHRYKVVLREDIDKVYWPHLYNLHGYYLANLREKGQRLTVVDIHQYLQKQPWQRVVFLMKKFMGEL